MDHRMREVFDWIRAGNLACGDSQSHSDFCCILDTLCNNGNGNNGDFYLLLHDFPDYCRAQEEVDKTYKNPDVWWKLSIKVYPHLHNIVVALPAASIATDVTLAGPMPQRYLICLFPRQPVYID